MRITRVHDIVAPISSAIANAYIDFSKMTASVVAIHTDLVRDGKPSSASASTRTAAMPCRACCASALSRASPRPIPRRSSTTAG